MSVAMSSIGTPLLITRLSPCSCTGRSAGKMSFASPQKLQIRALNSTRTIRSVSISLPALPRRQDGGRCSPSCSCSSCSSSAAPAFGTLQLKSRRNQAGSSSRLNSLPVDGESFYLANVAVGELSEGLDTPVQLLYLVFLMGFLVVGAYLVVRQVLIRRELEEAAKVLGERIRTGEASSEDCFELGVVLLRKKLYTQATKNLERAKRTWEGEPEELAQVHNALGFAYFNMEKVDMAIAEYQNAVKLQPGYVTAWNNLGDAMEKAKRFKEALQAYEEALTYAPDNKVALARRDAMKTRASRIGV